MEFELGNGIMDWELGFGIRIGNRGLELGIEIGDWDGIRDWALGLRIGHWGFGLGIGIRDWGWELGLRIGIGD